MFSIISWVDAQKKIINKREIIENQIFLKKLLEGTDWFVSTT